MEEVLLLLMLVLSNDADVITLLTRDEGVTWYGWQNVSNEGGLGLFSWGVNDQGTLGLNQPAPTKYSSPVQVGSGDWKSVSIWGYNRHSAIARKTDDSLWIWGYNDYGNLGLNDRTNRSSPTQIPGTTWGSVRDGSSSGWIGTKTDGTLWTVGDNTYGQLGVNNVTHRSSPVQVGSGTDWASGMDKVAAGVNLCHAIKTDGTLWSWGSNYNGVLGQNQAPAQLPRLSSPVQVPGTTWKGISSQNYASFAVKTDGTLWSWGWNIWGVLGQNQDFSPSTRGYSSPTQIPGTNWQSVSVTGGKYATAAIKTDGTLWAWGLNGQGMLGQNDTVTRSSPIQIPGTTWSTVSSGSYHFTATKTDGTGWVWGKNSEYGTLGQNSEVNYSSPIQIPGTWSDLQAGEKMTFGTKNV